MKTRNLFLSLLLACTLAFTGCGGEEDVQQDNASGTETPSTETSSTETEVGGSLEAGENFVDEVPEGMARNELSGELIDQSLANQRPIAVMIDNEKIALPHYGLTEADLVYEMVNSTQNDNVTRFMVMLKDWESIERLGNVRSARTTNCMLAMEWNAVLCHDGGPFYIDEYVALPSLDNLSGGFSRLQNGEFYPNGKGHEFTEYITTGEVADRLAADNIEIEYNNHYNGPHFNWSDEAVAFTDAAEVTEVLLPFPHNDSTLEYDAEDQLYYYSEYGQPHLDPANDNAQLCFKNVIVQSADMFEHDENGYMYYQLENESGVGYYITNGEAIEITWTKGSLVEPTKYYDANGNELVLNVGKTYIAIVPTEDWAEINLK